MELEKQTVDIIKFEKARFEKNKLSISDNITIEEWKDLGQCLKQVEGSVQFWIGDWARFGDKKGFTGKLLDRAVYNELEELTGLDRGTLKNYKSIADNVKPSLRNDSLSFNHHVEVAKLPEEQQIEFLQKAADEKMSVRELRQEIRESQHSDKKPTELPEGIFNIIYCDPPWQYDFAETDNRKIENQYPTMTVEELCEMKLPTFATDCLLLMWATSPKLCEALQVVQAWGFNYKTHSIWDKEKIGMGYWFRGQHELLIVATKGNFSPPEPDYRNSSVYREAREGHSVKPSFYYDWIDSAFQGSKIELFARSKREGWEAWGNESL